MSNKCIKKLDNGWQIWVSSTGKQYYHHKPTKNTTWAIPPEIASQVALLKQESPIPAPLPPKLEKSSSAIQESNVSQPPKLSEVSFVPPKLSDSIPPKPVNIFDEMPPLLSLTPTVLPQKSAPESNPVIPATEPVESQSAFSSPIIPHSPSSSFSKPQSLPPLSLSSHNSPLSSNIHEIPPVLSSNSPQEFLPPPPYSVGELPPLVSTGIDLPPIDLKIPLPLPDMESTQFLPPLPPINGDISKAASPNSSTTTPIASPPNESSNESFDSSSDVPLLNLQVLHPPPPSAESSPLPPPPTNFPSSQISLSPPKQSSNARTSTNSPSSGISSKKKLDRMSLIPSTPRGRPNRPSKPRSLAPHTSPLPPNWAQTISSTGKVYYYNKKTRESSWTRPTDMDVVVVKSHSKRTSFDAHSIKSGSSAISSASGSSGHTQLSQVSLDSESDTINETAHNHPAGRSNVSFPSSAKSSLNPTSPRSSPSIQSHSSDPHDTSSLEIQLKESKIQVLQYKKMLQKFKNSNGRLKSELDDVSKWAKKLSAQVKGLGATPVHHLLLQTEMDEPVTVIINRSHPASIPYNQLTPEQLAVFQDMDPIIVQQVKSYFKHWLFRRRFRKDVVAFLNCEHNRPIRQRNKSLLEILETEREYNSYIKTISTLFMPKSQKFMDTRTYDLLFGFIRQILLISDLFLSELEKEFKNYPSVLLGPIFSHFGPFFSSYTEYINSYNLGIKALAAMRKSPEFQFKIQKMETTVSQTSGRPSMTLESYLIMPIQRIPRYILLVREVLKRTTPTHNDYLPLTDAKSQLESTASFINFSKFLTEVDSRHEIASTKFGSLNSKFFAPNHRLFFGSIQCRLENQQSCVALIFTDCVIFLSNSKKNSFKPIGKFNLYRSSCTQRQGSIYLSHYQSAASISVLDSHQDVQQRRQIFHLRALEKYFKTVERESMTTLVTQGKVADTEEAFRFACDRFFDDPLKDPLESYVSKIYSLLPENAWQKEKKTDGKKKTKRFKISKKVADEDEEEDGLYYSDLFTVIPWLMQQFSLSIKHARMLTHALLRLELDHREGSSSAPSTPRSSSISSSSKISKHVYQKSNISKEIDPKMIFSKIGFTAIKADQVKFWNSILNDLAKLWTALLDSKGGFAGIDSLERSQVAQWSGVRDLYSDCWQ